MALAAVLCVGCGYNTHTGTSTIAASAGRFLFETRTSVKGLLASIVLGVFGIVILVALAVGLSQGKVPVGGGVLMGLLGTGLVYVLVSELKHLNEVERFYTDRAERLKSGKVVATLRYSDNVRMSFCFSPRDGDCILTLKGNQQNFMVHSANEGSFGNARNPPPPEVERLRDFMINVISRRMVAEVAAGGSFVVESNWVLKPKGMAIDGHEIDWGSLGVSNEGKYGDVEFSTKGAFVARRNMMADNAIPALHSISQIAAGVRA